MIFYPSDPSGFGYVDRNRTPEEIGQWATSTNDPEKVKDAGLALWKYADPNYTRASAEERSQAIDATLRIYEKYMGGKWEFTTPKSLGASPERIPFRTYSFLAETAQFNEKAKRHFFEIEPADNDLRNQWREAGEQFGLIPAP
jgi:hypothetical protein